LKRHLLPLTVFKDLSGVKIKRKAGKRYPKKPEPFAPKKHKKLCYNVLNVKVTMTTFAPLNTTTQ